MSKTNVTLKEFAKTCHTLLKSDRDCMIGVGGFTGEGKTQRKGSKVLMANGEWQTIENIKIGDIILSPQKDGTHIYSKVIHTHNRYSNNNYVVCQRNRQKKELYGCSHNHIIPVYNKVFPRKNGKRLAKDSYWGIRNYEAEALSKLCDSHTKIGFSSFAIERFKDRDNCIVEPYTLGIWLGDGHYSIGKISKNLGITTANFNIIHRISKFYKIISCQHKANNEAKTYRFSINSKLSKQLIFLGLEGKKSGSKFIPKEALLSDLSYRVKLLAGLIDSDGTYYHGGYSITTKSKRLSEDIRDLVYSLGGRVNVRKVKKGIKERNFIGEYYHVGFYLHNLKLLLVSQHKKKNCNSIYKASNRVDICLKKAKSEQVYGFTLNSPSGFYVTDNWMVTHNSCFTTQLMKAYSEVNKTEWDFNRLTWSRNELMTWVDGEKNSEKNSRTGLKKGQLPEYSAILPDELFYMFYKRTWYEEDQITSIATFNMCRDRHLFIGGNVPDIWDLDTGFLKRLRFYIYIPERGRAWVFEQENNPFTKDPWNVTENKKSFRKYRNPYAISNFICEIRFNDWATKEKQQYYDVRNNKRVKAINEAKIRKERYRDIKDQRDNCIEAWYSDRKQLMETLRGMPKGIQKIIEKGIKKKKKMEDILKDILKSIQKTFKDWHKPPTNDVIADIIGVSREAIRLIRKEPKKSK